MIQFALLCEACNVYSVICRGFFQTKVTEQHGGSQELQKLADLYSSDVSDGS